jgi:hypothetical protein
MKNLESSDTALLVFGNGDGGGGPLPKMLESVSKSSLRQNHPLNGRISPSCDALGLWRTRILNWSLSTWVNPSMTSSTMWKKPQMREANYPTGTAILSSCRIVGVADLLSFRHGELYLEVWKGVG